MKKNSILLIMFISLFFIFDRNVFAIGSCTCVYGTDDLAIKVELSDSSIPKVSFTGTAVTGSTIATVSLGSNNFAPVNFQDTASKKWKCPSTIYYNITTVGAAIKYTNLSTNENIGGAVSSFSLLSKKSSDGDYYEDVSDNSNDTIHCVYGNLILTIDNSNKVVNGSSSGCSDIRLPAYDDLSDKTKCPSYIYGHKYTESRLTTSVCHYSWTYSDPLTKIELNGEEPVFDASGNVVNSTVTENRTNETDNEYYTGCPLGEDVTKDIYGLLKILKIVAPLLVVGLTIFEFVKAIARSEIDGEAKKLGMRLVKRLIIAVILFFLPVLVNQIMIMANIWDENGTCDFSKSADQVDSSKSGGGSY